MFRKQARMVRLTAVERDLPLVWLTRTHSSLNTLTNYLCHDAKVKPESIVNGFMSERDFPALTTACGTVSASKLRMGDVNSTDEFEEVVLSLAEEDGFSYVLCDWRLSREEILLAKNMAQKGNVTVCWPP